MTNTKEENNKDSNIKIKEEKIVEEINLDEIDSEELDFPQGGCNCASCPMSGHEEVEKVEEGKQGK
jgi:hypothetical protein